MPLIVLKCPQVIESVLLDNHGKQTLLQCEQHFPERHGFNISHSSPFKVLLSSASLAQLLYVRIRSFHPGGPGKLYVEEVYLVSGVTLLTGLCKGAKRTRVPIQAYTPPPNTKGRTKSCKKPSLLRSLSAVALPVSYCSFIAASRTQRIHQKIPRPTLTFK